jgi:predicted hotdog family 3-hydroxylacyl-ACP dehydratase
MNPEEIPVIELLPHGPEFCLLDALVASSDNETSAVVEIGTGSKFLSEEGVPAYVGVEYMAQTIAARIGLHARLEGREPPIGFLLGTRHFSCQVGHFRPGMRLTIKVRPLFIDGRFGAFDCSIEADQVLAEAALNTYQPEAVSHGRKQGSES